MALFAPSQSPAVVVREIDLTGGVPNVQSTTGAFVGRFTDGPPMHRVLVANEAELVEQFGTPNDDNAVDYLTATQFLRYSGSLFVTRVLNTGTAKNACDSDATPDYIQDLADFENNNFDSIGQVFFRNPGSLGNSVVIHTCRALADSGGVNINDSNFSTWTYASSFDAAPTTSVSVAARGSTTDQFHLAVVDSNGEISGTRGTVLETFPQLSVAKDATNGEGVSNYAPNVVNNTSEYIYLREIGDYNFVNTTPDDTSLGDSSSSTSIQRIVLGRGTDGNAPSLGDFLSGWDLYEDKDQVEVDFLIARNMDSDEAQTSLVNDLVATAQSLRKDCVVVSSVHTSNFNDPSDAAKVTAITDAVANFTRSSYLIVDGNALKVYDKHNDKYRTIPAASTVAGVMAATDFNRAPWFSPAGSRRGQMLGITSLAFSPSKGQRDTLYKAGINPIANIPGQGALLFGDKTFLGRPSAFDRINVRRLFLVLEKAIGRAAEQTLFELNDEFTRAEFVNIVEPVLREVQGRRGITDFRVVCDETNNTPAVIDRNEFKADIFIKPARSINYVTISFVAVRTGADFEEIVGTV